MPTPMRKGFIETARIFLRIASETTMYTNRNTHRMISLSTSRKKVDLQRVGGSQRNGHLS